MKIGNKLKQIRELKGFKRSYLAMELGTSEKTIARIELDEISPTIDRLEQMALVLGVSIEEILGFDAKQVFQNMSHGQQGGEFNAYNATDVKLIKELYERMLSEKDAIINDLRNRLHP
jgi:transcriptional regulator with XRE-family HTH domain